MIMKPSYKKFKRENHGTWAPVMQQASGTIMQSGTTKGYHVQTTTNCGGPNPILEAPCTVIHEGSLAKPSRNACNAVF